MSDSSNLFNHLKAKILDRTAVVGVIGLGYVGLPFAVEKAKVGFHVIGVEQNPDRADAVNAAQNYIHDVDSDELAAVVANGKLKAICGFDQVSHMDVLVICVPTPLSKNMTPNLSYIESVTQGIAPELRSGQLITLESTTYPGTTDEVIKPVLESSGLTQGKDFS